MTATPAMIAGENGDWTLLLKVTMVSLIQPSSSLNLHKDGTAT